MATEAFNIRRLILGDPLATSQASHERLNKVRALAVFSSDALSSVAYATEEILHVLVLAGVAALGFSLPVAGGIAVLLVIVAVSYYQTIHAYPSGGGAYIVSKDNLGTSAGLVAAAALLIDYTLTVAVSAAAGIAALISAAPVLVPYRVPLVLVAIAVVTIINLRGVRESASVFAVPTYVFIVSVVGMLIYGTYRAFTGGLPPAAPAELAGVHGLEAVSLFLILRAYSAGCTALTGIEAISNGTPAFQKPEADNAGKTLVVMVALLGSMFLGITFLAREVGAVPNETETVLSQVARSVFGNASPVYFLIQGATMTILLLAANTAFNGFPLLASLIARDGFLPRPLSTLGDRLVYSNGIVVLGGLASVLAIAFRGDTHLLLPLYAVGVFLSFTLSQSGMVKHWFKLKPPGWRREALINGIGATATLVVLIVILVTRFTRGAWIVAVLIPLFVAMFRAIRRHYVVLAQQLSLEASKPVRRVRHQVVVVPIGGVHRGVLQAIEYARSLSDDVTAVYVEVDPQETERVREKWFRWGDGIRLKVLPSPYRSIMQPLLQYIDHLERESQPQDVITIVMPQFVPARWWHNLLHNQTAFLLRLALLYRKGVVVLDVPYQLAD